MEHRANFAARLNEICGEFGPFALGWDAEKLKTCILKIRQWLSLNGEAVIPLGRRRKVADDAKEFLESLDGLGGLSANFMRDLQDLARDAAPDRSGHGGDRRSGQRASREQHPPDDRPALYRGPCRAGICRQQVPMPGRDDIQTPVAVWGERIDGSARDMLAEAEAVRDDADEGGKFREAKDWLLDFLMDGARGAKECKPASHGDGHHWRTIERAKAELNISSVKRDGGRVWALPQDQDRQEAQLHSDPVNHSGVGGLGSQHRQEFGVGDVAGRNGGLDGWEGEI